MRSRLRRASARSGRSSVWGSVAMSAGVRKPTLKSEARFRILPHVSGTGFSLPVRSIRHMTASPGRTKWLALALLALTQFVIVLDASIVNVALPSIGHALDFSQDDLSWVVNAYTLTFGGFLLLGGRLADLLGRRRVFMAGLVLFSVASLAGGLAGVTGSQAQLIVA